MITLEVAQGSPEWIQARLGIPTASQFDRILTAKTLKVSAQSVGYHYELLAEYFLGQPVSDAGSGYMDRGLEMEREARTWYELASDVDVQPVGLCLTEDRRIGASPDGLVGSEGLVEIKCPSAAVHIGYLLNQDRLVEKYQHQVQGGLWVTGRQWIDLVSYHPSLPPVLVRVAIDADYQQALSVALAVFVKTLDQARRWLTARYALLPPERPS